MDLPAVDPLLLTLASGLCLSTISQRMRLWSDIRNFWAAIPMGLHTQYCYNNSVRQEAVNTPVHR